MYQVPGSGSVDLEFDFIFRGAILPNDLNAFVVDDVSGSIAGTMPGDVGYDALAAGRAVEIFAPGAGPSTPDRVVAFEGGDLLAFYINNGTHNFYSLDEANPDDLDHFVGFESATLSEFGFEDLFGGGDLDYDDVVFTVDPPLPALGGLRYDQVQQKSSHNSYERGEALLDQMVYHRVRSIELDIHNGKFGQEARDDDWFVYHGPQRGTTCNRLSDCLDEIAAFHDQNPQHEVLTVWIDQKDDWEPGRTASSLDNLLRSRLGGTIYEPGDLAAACGSPATMQAAVESPCAWPTLAELRGRIIFVITGGDDPLENYATTSAEAAVRSSFIAPNFNSLSDDAVTAWSQAVFFNIKNKGGDDWVDIAAEVRSSGLVDRVWKLNSSGDWTKAVDVHHLATDKVNFHEDEWSRTHDETTGWPFELFSDDGVARTEVGQVLGVVVDSEDIWNRSDDFLLTYRVETGPTDWTTSITTPNTHVQQWAKGCLMARQSRDDDSAYFAVCRPADKHWLRVQIRPSTGAKTTATEKQILAEDDGEDRIDEESLTYVRLTVYSDGSQTCANGYGSQNGITWV